MRLFTYGTLRKGRSNHREFSGMLNFVETAVTREDQFIMYGTSYPYVLHKRQVAYEIRESMIPSQITGDVFEITDENAFAQIAYMEIQAGYTLISVHLEGTAEALMWVSRDWDVVVSPKSVVPSGDWNQKLMW